MVATQLHVFSYINTTALQPNEGYCIQFLNSKDFTQVFHSVGKQIISPIGQQWFRDFKSE